MDHCSTRFRKRVGLRMKGFARSVAVELSHRTFRSLSITLSADLEVHCQYMEKKERSIATSVTHGLYQTNPKTTKRGMLKVGCDRTNSPTLNR